MTKNQIEEYETTMPVQNSDIVNIFNKLADLLDIKGDNPFKIRAYRQAAFILGGLSENVSDMIERGEDLTQFSGIGKELSVKIHEIVHTGKLSKLEELENEIPEELLEMLKISFLGPRKISTLYKKLNIRNIDQLEKTAKAGKIRNLEGFGQKTEHNIIEEIKLWRERNKEKGKGKRIKRD